MIIEGGALPEVNSTPWLEEDPAPSRKPVLLEEMESQHDQVCEELQDLWLSQELPG